MKIFNFYPKWHQIPPILRSDDLGWPRKPFFLNHWTNSFILVYNLSRFENVWILTPNDPKYPQVTSTPNLQNKNLYPVLGFNLSYLKLWLVNCVTSYLKNKPKPEAHKTGSRTNSEKSIREKYSFREFWRWDRGVLCFRELIFFLFLREKIMRNFFFQKKTVKIFGSCKRSSEFRLLIRYKPKNLRYKWFFGFGNFRISAKGLRHLGC